MRLRDFLSFTIIVCLNHATLYEAESLPSLSTVRAAVHLKQNIFGTCLLENICSLLNNTVSGTFCAQIGPLLEPQ